METDKLRRPRVNPRARLMNIRRQISQITRATSPSPQPHPTLVAGCVGPAYVKPKVDTPPAFKESSPAAYTSADPGAWQPAQPQDAALKGKWWEVFAEPELNALEDQLNINNQNIAQFFRISWRPVHRWASPARAISQR